MNRYVQEIMNSSEGLPKTFEDYQLLSPERARMVPMSHIAKLREEHDNKLRELQKPKLTKINF